MSIGTEKVLIIAFIGLVVVYSIGLVNSFELTSFVTNKVNEQKEASRSAGIQVIQLLDKSCKECFDIKQIEGYINNQQVVEVTSLEEVELDSNDAKRLIDTYNLKLAPVLIIMGEVSKSNIKDLWNQLGGTIFDNSTVLISGPLPYRDLQTNEILGLVKLIELDDKSCTHCYNVSIQEGILRNNFGVYINEIQKFDIASQEGKTLVAKYEIKAVPTVLISPDASAYQNLVGVWSQVGFIANDGWLVFNNTQVMYNNFGGYRDLTTGEEVSK